MSNSKHQKHAAIKRPALGQYGRNEIAILGTTCGKIQQLAKSVIQELGGQFKLAYVDSDHKSADEVPGEKTSALDYGAWQEYTDKIGYHRFDVKADLEVYQNRMYFNEADLILVNGNHFKASKQIVVIDAVKLKSLSRKLDRLTDVQLILLTEGQTELPDFLKEKLQSVHNVPILKMKERKAIVAFFRNQITEAIPPIYGLVLAGGKSQRMGQDKGLLSYHGKPQREYMADMLSGLCTKTFLSCRADQAADIESAYPLLPDSFTGLGPFGALLTAFREAPEAAWMVIACDLPLLDASTLSALITERDSAKVATCYRSPVNEFPEPLIAIWEPKAYPIALQFLAQGYSCPRKVLINTDIKELIIQNANKLLNANRREEYEEIKKMLSES